MQAGAPGEHERASLWTRRQWLERVVLGAAGFAIGGPLHAAGIGDEAAIERVEAQRGRPVSAIFVRARTRASWRSVTLPTRSATMS